jgi:hypothetical protein
MDQRGSAANLARPKDTGSHQHLNRRLGGDKSPHSIKRSAGHCWPALMFWEMAGEVSPLKGGPVRRESSY